MTAATTERGSVLFVEHGTHKTIYPGYPVTSGAVLREYREQSVAYGASEDHVAAVRAVELAFAQWQDAHADLVKVPD